jgi:hypothetical protein
MTKSSDARDGAANTDIFAQRLNGAGVPQWTANGVAVSKASADQTTQQLLADGS